MRITLSVLLTALLRQTYAAVYDDTFAI